MRVVILGAEMSMNGASLMLCRWAEHLHGQGHDVGVVPRDFVPGPLEARFAAAGIEIITTEDVPLDNRTLVICNTIFSAHLLLRASAYSRCIWWIHEGEAGRTVLKANPELQQAFSHASAVIFPVPYLIEEIYRDFLLALPQEKLETIYVVRNGIDMPAEASLQMESEGGPLRIATVGTLYPRKRQIDVVRAVAALPDLELECRLVGKAVDIDDDMRRIIYEDPDRVRLIGEVPYDQSLAVIDESDILVHPSGDEAFPLVLLEAGIRGKPLILANLPVYRGIWRHGENCLMHAVGDVALLSGLISILARDPGLRARFGAAAQATARNYRYDGMLAHLDNIVARVMGASERPASS